MVICGRIPSLFVVVGGHNIYEVSEYQFAPRDHNSCLLWKGIRHDKSQTDENGTKWSTNIMALHLTI